jgi:predicted XRE-type DNA-binding protein
MSVPLDRLYHYIENQAEKIHGDRVIIYRFWPHGSKNIRNLLPLRPHPDWVEKVCSPHMWCNDQEPLDFAGYEHRQELNESWYQTGLVTVTKQFSDHPRHTNFRYNLDIRNKAILLHSEQRSQNVEQYQQNEFVPVYYWCHAVIARDWFRFAQYLTQKKQAGHMFLIYNRAWAGTREYRLKFAENLIRLGLENHCKMSVSPVEPELGIHYNLHEFSNPAWRPTHVIEKYFPVSTAKSHYSADFDMADYESTHIEVVLETLFDDSRLHLTEKILRPIACGQPFILAGTHLSLEYLRRYGFQTFDSVWNESYDQETDPQERLVVIADLMRQIANWHPELREQKLREAQAIADYNKKHFFSEQFQNIVHAELVTNLQTAFDQLKQPGSTSRWIQDWEGFLAIPEFKNQLTDVIQDDILKTIAQAKNITAHQDKL